jgi:hypothetical protein
VASLCGDDEGLENGSGGVSLESRVRRAERIASRARARVRRGARCRGRWGRWPERGAEGDGAEGGRSGASASSRAVEHESEMQRESETKSNGDEAERWPVEIFG